MKTGGGCGLGRAWRRAGFTLVEIALAATVLAIAVLTAFEVQLAAHSLARTSRETSTATADLAAAMEELLLLPKDSIPIATSPFAPGQPIAAYSDLHLAGQRIVAAYPGYVPGAAVPDPLEIVLTETWSDHAGRPRTLRIASMKTR
jgi:hypothetical protein